MQITITDSPEVNRHSLKEGERVVVKCQRSLMSSDDKPKFLAYDKSQRLFVMMPLPDEIKERFGDRLKFFAMGRIVGTELVIDEDVRDPGW